MKNLNKSQVGIVPLIVIGFVVVLGVAGFAAWKVLETKKDFDKKSENPKSSQTGNSKKPYEYINQEWGFKFTVKEWFPNWRVNVTEDTLAKSTAGSAYSISWTDKFGGGFVTKDWKSSTNVQGFTKYEECIPSTDYENIVTLYHEDDLCVKVAGFYDSFFEKNSKIAMLIIQKKFKNNNKIAGLEFIYAPIVTEDFSGKSLKTVYDYSVDTGRGKLQAELIEFAKSIEEL